MLLGMAVTSAMGDEESAEIRVVLDVARGVMTGRGSICPQVVMHLVEAVVRSTQGADELRVRSAVVGVKG